MTKIITAKDVIRAALPLVENEHTWTQGVFARDETGLEVEPDASRAVRWCAEGALKKVGGLANGEAIDTALGTFLGIVGYGLHHINDCKGREAVVALFKKALAA
jgi:hypothetical protein